MKSSIIYKAHFRLALGLGSFIFHESPVLAMFGDSKIRVLILIMKVILFRPLLSSEKAEAGLQ